MDEIDSRESTKLISSMNYTGIRRFNMDSIEEAPNYGRNMKTKKRRLNIDRQQVFASKAQLLI